MADKEYPTEVIATIYSGFLMCDFGDMKEVAGRLARFPVWTHSLPAVRDLLRPKIAESCPAIAAFDFSRVNPTTVWAERERLLDVCGEKVSLSTPLISKGE